MRRAIYRDHSTHNERSSGHHRTLGHALRRSRCRSPSQYRKATMFTTDERVEMIREVIPASNVSVDTFEGLLVHYAVAQQAQFVVRGIRAISDYEYELQMAL